MKGLNDNMNNDSERLGEGYEQGLNNSRYDDNVHGKGKRGDNIELTDFDEAFEDFGETEPEEEPASAPWEQTRSDLPPMQAGVGQGTGVGNGATGQAWGNGPSSLGRAAGQAQGTQPIQASQTQVIKPAQADQDWQSNFTGLADEAHSTGRSGRSGRSNSHKRNTAVGGSHSASKRLWTVLGIVAEILFTVAAICALYIIWQMWWTGVQSEHTQAEQRQSVSWSDPAKSANSAKGVSIAQPQSDAPPVQPTTANSGDIIAQIYIPRFGDQWQRNIVEGTDAVELNQHGMGHYPHTQMPGQVGNFAAAGHRNGYGQPLGDIDKLQVGDPIVLRTKDYWYVYDYTSFKKVTPDQVSVVDANPENPGTKPTERMITLTTCEPKYGTPVLRWIAYGKLKYWAKVSDGVPAELTHQGANGAVQFINNGKQSPASKLPSLIPVVIASLIVYAILFILAALLWRWPLRRKIRDGEVKRPTASIYGGLLRLQPGIKPVRILLLLILLFAIAVAIMQWGCPWAASNIPILHQMSNYVAVTS